MSHSRALFTYLMLFATSATSEPARVMEPGIPAFPNFTCYHIDARSGWQSVNTDNMHNAAVLIFGSENRELQQKVGTGPHHGWSVDAAHYSPVGASGHTGADAAALRPYDQYKYDADYPFGALLMRWDGAGRVLPLEGFEGAIEMPNPTQFIEFRINDSDASLGDNGGEIVLCVIDARRLQ